MGGDCNVDVDMDSEAEQSEETSERWVVGNNMGVETLEKIKPQFRFNHHVPCLRGHTGFRIGLLAWWDLQCWKKEADRWQQTASKYEHAWNVVLHSLQKGQTGSWFFFEV